MSADRSDVLERYRAFPSSSSDVDLRAAPDDVLRRHGFPGRPDPDKQPGLARVWSRVFAGPTRVIGAELEIDERMGQRTPLPTADGPAFAQGGWAGAAVQTNPLGFGEPATWVFAQWVVPTVYEIDPAGYDSLTVAFWVGIDGFASLGDQVLQAGVAAKVDPGWFSNDVDWYPWTEWYTMAHKDPPVCVPNFSVRPGDTISVLVCAPTPDSGQASFVNTTRGQATTVHIKTPSGFASAGKSVEWVVEQASSQLPSFSPITFTQCLAGTDHHVFDLAHAQPFEIIGHSSSGSPYGTAITRTTLAQPSCVLVEWQAFE